MIKFHALEPVALNLNSINTALSQLRNDPMNGWFELPEHPDQEELQNIKSAAAKIQSDSDYLVCIGIGGSYLGHRAIIEALKPLRTEPPKNPNLPAPKPLPEILYAGNSLSSLELEQLLHTISDHDFSINVISKSGTTTEPAVAFRILKQKLLDKYGDAAKSRIYATTDASKGALHGEAVSEGYTRFVVPDNIGGRYSVLSAVGLLPLATAGVDIDALLAGAHQEYQDTFGPGQNLSESAPIRYAATRAELLSEKFTTEIFATFEPCLQLFQEWWKQLFGESEGKNHQGIFPASVVYTTDLHSLGQYLQDGRRDIFETVLNFEQAPSDKLTVPNLPLDLDGLGYLVGKPLSYLNEQARIATIAAHRMGGIPVFELLAPDLSARSLGALVYFYELSCALSAYFSGVNPFDQPGVEAYKNNMFRLLGKPGF